MREVQRILFMAEEGPLSPDEPEPPLDGPLHGWDTYQHGLYQCLTRFGVEVVTARTVEDLLREGPNADFVVSAYWNPKMRSDRGTISDLCRAMDLPCWGTDARTNALFDDKHVTKLLARSLRIPTAAWLRVDPATEIAETAELPYPCFVKPAGFYDSILVDEDSICPDHAAVTRKLAQIHATGENALIEKFIPGLDLTIGCMADGDDLTVGKLISIESDALGSIQTHDQKMKGGAGRTKFYVDAPEITEKVVEYCRRLYSVMRPIDFFRPDFRLNKETGELMFVEVNQSTINVGSNFCVSMGADAESYPSLIHEMVSRSMARYDLRLPSIPEDGA